MRLRQPLRFLLLQMLGSAAIVLHPHRHECQHGSSLCSRTSVPACSMEAWTASDLYATFLGGAPMVIERTEYLDETLGLITPPSGIQVRCSHRC
jgi:hypothetical protein